MPKRPAEIAVTGYMKVAPNCRAALVDILRTHISNVREKDGCVLYSFAEDVIDQHIIRMIELWRDQGALDSHLKSDEFNAVRRRVEALEILDRSVQKHRISATEEI